MKWALKTGHHVIRIVQEDIWLNKIDWQTLLKDAIEELSKEITPRVLYIENPLVKSIYQDHKDDMKTN